MNKLVTTEEYEFLNKFMFAFLKFYLIPAKLKKIISLPYNEKMRQYRIGQASTFLKWLQKCNLYAMAN